MGVEVTCNVVGLGNNVVVDKYYIPVATIHRRFSVEIANSKDFALYPTLVSSIENWTFNGSNTLNLATVAAHSSIKSTQQIVRDKPAGTLVSDIGYMTVKLYQDAARTILWDECPFYSTIYVVSLPDFTSIQEWDFDDGTPQGWTLENMDVSNVRKYGATGYSARGYDYHSWTIHTSRYAYSLTCRLSKSVTIPIYANVFGRAMLYLKSSACHNSGAGDCSAKLFHIMIKFGDTVIFQTVSPIEYVSASGLYYKCCATSNFNWIPLSFNLNTCRGQTNVLLIETYIWGEAYGKGDYYGAKYVELESCLDEVMIGAI